MKKIPYWKIGGLLILLVILVSVMIGVLSFQ